MKDYIPSPNDFCPVCHQATIYVVDNERHCLIGCSIPPIEVAS